MFRFAEEVKQLTKELVKCPSIVGTQGEKELARRIAEKIRQMPYFRDNPHLVKLAPTRSDDRERFNVLALVKGKPGRRETVILMGHLDTVGVEDFGPHRELAFSPDRLLEEWKRRPLPPAVAVDVASGDYLSGRGVLDMKSGIAINLVLLRHFSERAGELNGNLMFLATCDEENDSRGMWSALEDLWEWKEQEGLDYIAAINSDYTAPRYEGDPHRYLYLGTVGKLLPTFFIVGRETHAGQPFSGFDPNLVAAALTKRIDYNPAFCDEMDGEVTPPPVSLKQADLKQKYDVQTPVSAYVYFNFFVFRRTPAEVLALLKEVATESFREAVSLHEERLKAYAERTGEPYRPAGIEPRVFTIEEFLNDARRRLGQELDSALEQFKEDLLRDGNMDVRDFSLRVTEELWRLAGDGEPAVILFYSSPYIPRVMPDESDERYLRLFSAVRESVAAVASHCSHPIQVRKFFPYISDMSFVALSDSDEEIAAFARNMPAWGVKYCLDADAIRRLQVPAVNIGPYGKDAHKQWERLELSYSTKIAPELTAGVIRRLIGERAYEC